MALDLDLEEFSRLLRKACDIVVRFYDGLDGRRVFHGMSVADVQSRFDEALPRAPGDLDEILRTVERDVYGAATLNVAPNFYAYVLSGGNHAAIIADLLGTAMNQTGAKWHLGASITELERRVIRWIAEFIGYPVDTGGVLESGGTGANLICLTAAVRTKAPWNVRAEGLAGRAQITMYVSEEGHSALDKCVDLLGIGQRHLRKIPVRPDFTIDLDALERAICDDRAAGHLPVCVIGNAGTVNTGAIDPLEPLEAVCARHHLWFHVDAAYGGPAASTAIAGARFAGLERAHSVALDPHKWLYVPVESGCALVRDSEQLRNAFSLVPPYLREADQATLRVNLMEYTMQLTRAGRALKTWMTFKAYGANRLREAIEENIHVMQRFGRLIDESEDFERLAPVTLSVVCFRYRPPDVEPSEQNLARLNASLLAAIERDGRVFVAGTVVRGQAALRVCCVNHRTETRHVEYLLDVLRELGRAAAQSL